MLKTRLTDPRWVIWLYDPALPTAVADHAITHDALYEYAASRDIEALGGLDAVSAWRVPPTLFLLKPMMSSWHPIEDNPTALFQQSCSEIRNGEPAWSQWERRADGSRFLSDSATDLIPRGCVLDLGRLVCEMATRGGDTLLPFTLPDGWHPFTTMTIAQAVIAARINAAKSREAVSSTAVS
jgi:hypothetical protein